jgi:voltage-gated potassium channel
MGQLSRVRLALLALCAVLVVGTIGYVVLGFSVLDARYQTVTTVTTVGFREVQPLTPAGQVFTIALILTGVGTALYTLGVLLEALIEGDLRKHVGRRRMDKTISRMTGENPSSAAGAASACRARTTSSAPDTTSWSSTATPPGCRT